MCKLALKSLQEHDPAVNTWKTPTDFTGSVTYTMTSELCTIYKVLAIWGFQNVFIKKRSK